VIAEEAVSYTIPGKGVTAKTVKYRISDLRVDYFEGPSRFQKKRDVGGIDVSNVSGIVVIGNDNLVQSQFESLYRHLDYWSSRFVLTTAYPLNRRLNILRKWKLSRASLPSPDLTGAFYPKRGTSYPYYLQSLG